MADNNSTHKYRAAESPLDRQGRACRIACSTEAVRGRKTRRQARALRKPAACIAPAVATAEIAQAATASAD